MARRTETALHAVFPYRCSYCAAVIRSTSTGALVPHHCTMNNGRVVHVNEFVLNRSYAQRLRHWLAQERRRRLQTCRPTTLDPLMDRLPAEAMRMIVEQLESMAMTQDQRAVDERGLLSHGHDDQLVAYMGLAGLAKVNKAFHAMVTPSCSVQLSFRCAAFGPEGRRPVTTLNVPLIRGEHRNLVYAHEPPGPMLAFPVTAMDVALPQAILHCVRILAPEVMEASARIAARKQMEQGLHWRPHTLTPTNACFRYQGVPHTANLNLAAGTLTLVLFDPVSAPDYWLAIFAERVPYAHRRQQRPDGTPWPTRDAMGRLRLVWMYLDRVFIFPKVRVGR
jgi:hypothetical protein